MNLAVAKDLAEFKGARRDPRLSSVNGNVELFTAGAMPWHSLGVNVSSAQTWLEASRLARLDWSVSKLQLTSPLTGQPIDAWALFRDDNSAFLAPAGRAYTPIQNAQAFAWVDALIESHAAHYISAGALGAGEVMWCCARLGKSLEPVKGDKLDANLLFVERRDGGAATIKLTLERPVCRNTVSIALADARVSASALRLRHTSGVTAKLEAAKALMSGVTQNVKTLEEKFRRLSEKRVDPPTLAKVLKDLFPNLADSTVSQNKARDILVNFQANDNNAIPGIKDTAWSLLNACTRWVDHQRGGLRVGDRDESLVRAESAMFGTGDEFKRQALDTILSAVGLGEQEVVTVGGGKVDSILSAVAI